MATQEQTFVIYRPDIWAPYIDQLFQAKLLTTKFFDNWSDYATEGGKTIIVPQGVAFTAGSITTTTGEVTGNAVTDTGIRLDINTWYGNKQMFSDFMVSQVSSNYRLKEQKAQDMAYALAKVMDSSVMALITGLYPSRVVNASTAGLKSSDLESAIAIIESYNIPKEECAFFFAPKAYYQEILAVQKFYDASQFGEKTAISTGNSGTLYGIPVFVTSQVPTPGASAEGGGHRNFLIHKRAIAFALGNLPNRGNAYAMPSGVRVQEKNAEALRVSVISDIMYGVKTVGGSYRGVRLISKN